MRTMFGILTLGVVLMTACAGCQYMGSASHKGSATAAIAHVAGTTLDIETENGSVEVRHGGSDVSVAASMRATTAERLKLMSVSVERSESGTVMVRPIWPQGGRVGSEGCSVVVTLPDVGDIAVSTGNGSILIAGGAGDCDLETSNGAIQVDGPAGAMRVKTSNGRVTLTGVRSATVDTSNGSVSVVLSEDAEGPVAVDTSNGSISLAVGGTMVGTLTASTSNGGVSESSGRATRSVQSGKTRGVFELGGISTPASSLDTSNGSITITRR
jgi:DUF4097 and DUF4098 domain-containing protein YvlB